MVVFTKIIETQIINHELNTLTLKITLQLQFLN